MSKKDEALISLITELVGTVALYDWKEATRLGKRVQQALAAPVQDSDHEFKNFHRLLCDQISLIEWIAKQVKPAAPVPLTDDQINTIRFSISTKAVTQRDFELARAIEAAHNITKGEA